MAFKKKQVKPGVILEVTSGAAQDSGSPFLLVIRVGEDGFHALRSDNKRTFYVNAFSASDIREQHVGWKTLRSCRRVRA